MSPDVRDLLSDAVPPPRGADTDAILRRSRQIARRQRAAGGLAAALLLPAIALGALQVADRDALPPAAHHVTASPSPGDSASDPAQGPRGIVPVPPKGSVRGAQLEDGRRVVVTHAPNGDITVVDLASPVEVGGLRQTLAWCAPLRRLVDASSGAQFDMHGGPTSAVTREWATTYRTERVDAARVRVLAVAEPPGEAVGLGEAPGGGEACPERPASLVVGAGSTSVSEGRSGSAGSVAHVTGVIVVDESGSAVMCDRVRAKRCLDISRQASDGTRVAGLPSVTHGRAIAGTFLVRRTAAGFEDVLRDANVDLQTPVRDVAYVHGMAPVGDAATNEGYLLTVDERDLLTGDAMTQHVYDTGGELPAASSYVIPSGGGTRTQLRAGDTTLYLLQKSSPPDFPQQVSAEEFRAEVVRRAPGDPMLAEIVRGTDASGPQSLASISEFFVP